MNVSSGNRCQSINQALKIYGQCYWKKKEYMYFNIFLMVGVWPPYNMLYCMEIALISCYGWYLRSAVNSACRLFFLYCILYCWKISTKNWLVFSISAQKYSDFSEYLEISCTGLAIFAISLLLLMIIPGIRVVLPKSSEYLMYLIVVADPAVSCKKNRSSLMNFPNIQGFPQREHLSTFEYLWLSQIFGILIEIGLNK